MSSNEENINLNVHDTNLNENVASVNEENITLNEHVHNLNEENINLNGQDKNINENVASLNEEKINLNEHDTNINIENTNVNESIDIFDPRNWDTLDIKSRDILIEKGPIREMNLVFPKDIFSRHFSYAFYTRKLNNGYNDWKHLSERLKEHENSNEHFVCMSNWNEAKRRLDKNLTIDNELQQEIIKEKKTLETRVIQMMVEYDEFLKVDDTSGLELFNELLDALKLLDLNVDDIRGFTSSMNIAKTIALDMGIEPHFHQNVKLKSLSESELKESCIKFATTFSKENVSDVDSSELFSELKVLKMILPNDIIYVVDILDFVKALDCYPNTFIAYRILLTIPPWIKVLKFLLGGLDQEQNRSKVKVNRETVKENLSYSRPVDDVDDRSGRVPQLM
ncbi:uncharacterized protein LOC111883363 [Lactuca sativa]|uniref:uncharacterized protein LOC111883363 n=1 Tax=Lactuca sativa TaxID=4236 RepID=UPI000CD96FD4|nr:uncharacterized protein LOC111883363 [Lactuca sativa]